MASIADLQLILKQKHIPTDISHDILCMVFQMEHRDKVQRSHLLKDVVATAHRKGLLGDSDLETTINHYYNCDCCIRHQIRKPCITPEGLSIMTKPCVFKQSVYDDVDEYGEPYCKCTCRHLARWHTRSWLKKNTDWGPITNWSRSKYSLAIYQAQLNYY